MENVYVELLFPTPKTYTNGDIGVNVADELRKIREQRLSPKLSMAEMAKLLEFKGASSYQRYEDATVWENRRFPDDFVFKLLKVLIGRGNPPIDSAEILGLGSLYEFVIKEINEPILLSGARSAPYERGIPLITPKQVDMFAAGQTDFHDKQDYVVQKIELGPRAFRLIVEGKSMEPVFHHGDELICDPDATVDPGNYVVAKLDTEIAAAIRQYRVSGFDDGEPIIELIPANPNFPTVRLGGSTPGRIYAKVVKFTRTLE